MEAAGCAVAAGILIFHKSNDVGRTSTERYRAALLGSHRDSRQVFLSFGALDYRLRRCDVARIVLSGSYAVTARLAVNVAISRVIVGMHFLSDVLVGSGMGALSDYAAYTAFANNGLYGLTSPPSHRQAYVLR